jgi:type III secretion system YscQ/HrcQ family protein
MLSLRPFSFASLRRVTRSEVALTRAIVRRCMPLSSSDSLLGEAWKSMQSPVLVHHAPPWLDAPGALIERFDGAMTCVVCAHPVFGVVVAACEHAFALDLACAALSVAPEARASFSLSSAWEGALFAIASRITSRTWNSATPPVVRAVTESFATAIEAIAPRERLVVWPMTLRGDEGTAAALLIADADALMRAPEPQHPWPARVLDVPVAWSLSAAAAWWSPSDVASLALGDVLGLDALTHHKGTLAGHAMICVASRAAFACSVTLTSLRSITLTSELQCLGDTMNDHDPQLPSTARLASLPIELSVEIARGSALVGDLAAWRVGEVLTLDTPIGDVVLVRANGRPVCRGELVDVEGTVGVRITEVL